MFLGGIKSASMNFQLHVGKITISLYIYFRHLTKEKILEKEI